MEPVLNSDRPFHISIGPNPEGTKRVLAIRHIAANAQSNCLTIPLAEGVQMIAAAFESLANTPDAAALLAQTTSNSRMVELMRRFVAQYDQHKALI